MAKQPSTEHAKAEADGKGRRSAAKKRRGLPAWCWYCDRTFDDEQLLVVHQRTRHFACLWCPRKLRSASGLVVHAAQVHRRAMDRVPNAIPEHDSPEIDIYGEQGVPGEDLQRHRQGLPPLAFRRTAQVSSAGLITLIAAQKLAPSSANAWLSSSNAPSSGAPSRTAESQAMLMRASPLVIAPVPILSDLVVHDSVTKDPAMNAANNPTRPPSNAKSIEGDDASSTAVKPLTGPPPSVASLPSSLPSSAVVPMGRVVRRNVFTDK